MRQSLGCSLLEAKGITPPDKAMVKVSDEDIIQYCEPCHYGNCRLTGLEGIGISYTACYHEAVEEVYQCKKCGAMETLSFFNGKLQPTMKFTQVGNTIYHTTNCGECRRIM